MIDSQNGKQSQLDLLKVIYKIEQRVCFYIYILAYVQDTCQDNHKTAALRRYGDYNICFGWQ